MASPRSLSWLGHYQYSGDRELFKTSLSPIETLPPTKPASLLAIIQDAGISKLGGKIQSLNFRSPSTPSFPPLPKPKPSPPPPSGSLNFPELFPSYRNRASPQPLSSFLASPSPAPPGAVQGELHLPHARRREDASTPPRDPRARIPQRPPAPAASPRRRRASALSLPSVPPDPLSLPRLRLTAVPQHPTGPSRHAARPAPRGLTPPRGNSSAGRRRLTSDGLNQTPSPRPPVRMRCPPFRAPPQKPRRGSKPRPLPRVSL